MADNYDDIESFTRHDTEKKMPLGWVILFVLLVLFGAYYVISFTPEITGWSQYSEFAEAIRHTH
jgi:hypothetical protein